MSSVIDKYKQNKLPVDNPELIDKSLFPSGFKHTKIHKHPNIYRLKRFLNTSECQTLIDMAKGQYTRSTIVVDGNLTTSGKRTSETAYVTRDGQKDVTDPDVLNILNKVSYLVGCDKGQIEGLMVVKYKQNCEYYNHYDFFEPEAVNSLDDGGQRICTFFVYLNSLGSSDGGETEFPKVNTKVKPSRGTAVFWWDVKKSGKVDRNTLHRGNPVKRGVKYGLNIWVREKGW